MGSVLMGSAEVGALIAQCARTKKPGQKTLRRAFYGCAAGFIGY